MLDDVVERAVELCGSLRRRTLPPGDKEIAVPDPSTTADGPVLRQADGQRDRRHRGSDHPRGLRRATRATWHARRSSHLKKTGIADGCFIGPEPEFFIFDEVRYEQTQHRGFYQIDSVEGAWNTARFEEPNLGYKPSYKGGYFPVSPTDTYHDLRGEMVRDAQGGHRRRGAPPRGRHRRAGRDRHEVRAAAGDGRPVHVVQVHHQERRQAHGKTVTFMPKPIFDDNGSGMHTHMSLWKGNAAVRRQRSTAGLSEMAMHGVGGLLKHARAVLAFAAPTNNSYRRLVPGFEAPVNLAMSARNRSAAVRIPMYSTAPRPSGSSSAVPTPAATAT